MAKSLITLLCIAASLAVVASCVSAGLTQDEYDSDDDDDYDMGKSEPFGDVNDVYSHEKRELQRDIILMEEMFKSARFDQKIIRTVAHQNFHLAYMKREQFVRTALNKFVGGQTGADTGCKLVYRAHEAGLEEVFNVFQRMLTQLSKYENAHETLAGLMDKSEERFLSRLSEWRKFCIFN